VSASALIGIAAAARLTGLSAHALRAWERRYGFPAPKRAVSGERLYPAEQLDKLALLRSLADRGHRPAKIARLSVAELERILADPAPEPLRAAGAFDPEPYFQGLASASHGELRRRLHAGLVRQGLGRFVVDTLVPLARRVGEWQETGRIETVQEHLFRDQVERLLREAMAPLDADRPTKIMLTTFPSERHGLGLLMAEALLRLEGASCIPVGLETPTAQIVRFAAQSRADIVALSFSAAYADPNGHRLLSGLRDELPARVALWAGGEGARKIVRALPGVSVFRDLDDMVVAFRRQYAAV
jgi:MerR family transcriptional regulator, light-induced transcriptional regulator